MKSIEHYEQLAREAKAEGVRSGIVYGKRCKHKNADHLPAGEASTWGGPLAGLIAIAEQFRCVDCGAWLSLGPSNDNGRRVLVEIQLAARLADVYVLWEPGASRDLSESLTIKSALCIDERLAILNHDAEQAETGGEA